MFGNNIKVHFAGCEQIDFAMVAHAAGVRYFLYTCFPLLCRQFGIKGFPITVKTLFPPKEIDGFAKHAIMDSGLFTLMFGAHAGPRSEQFLTQWQDAIIQFVKENGIQATVVEVDCQKLLGPETAWRFRTRLKDQLKNRQINVFHYEDGQKGLDRLIEFSDYIAISVPELRIIDRKRSKEDTYRLACYIKNRKPQIDIHLLGCTEPAMLKRCRFCTSSDSTSWQSVNRFGSILNYQTSQIKDEARRDAAAHCIPVMERCGLAVTDKRLAYYSN